MAATVPHLIGCHSIGPIVIVLAVTGNDVLATMRYTQQGYLPMQQADGEVHYQPFLIHHQATDWIMSLEAIILVCPEFDS